MKSLTKLLFIGLLFASAVSASEYSGYDTTSQHPQPMPSRGSFTEQAPGSVLNQPVVTGAQPIVLPSQSPAGGITPTVPHDWNKQWENREK